VALRYLRLKFTDAFVAEKAQLYASYPKNNRARSKKERHLRNTVHLTKKLSGRFCVCIWSLFCHFLSSPNSFGYIKFYEMLHICNTCRWCTNVSNLCFYKTCCKTVQQSLNRVKHTNIAWEELVLWIKKLRKATPTHSCSISKLLPFAYDIWFWKKYEHLHKVSSNDTVCSLNVWHYAPVSVIRGYCRWKLTNKRCHAESTDKLHAILTVFKGYL